MTTTEKDTLADLIERLEKATGPDRELDGEIFAAVETHPYGDVIAAKGGMIVYAGSAPHAPGQGRFEVAPRYTSSLDAALALVDEKMGAEWPCYEVHARMVRSGGEWFHFWEITVPSREFQGRSHHPAIALLTCLLRALQQGDQS